MNRQRQKELESAYLKEWQPQQKDALQIIEECALQMLEDSYERITHLMEYHRLQYYKHLHIPPLDKAPFTCRLQFMPSLLYDQMYLEKGTSLYIQGEQLLAIQLLEDIMVQQGKLSAFICYDPQAEHLQIHDTIEHLPLFHKNHKYHQHFQFTFGFANCFENMQDPIINLYMKGRTPDETNDIYQFFNSDKVIWKILVNDQEVNILSKLRKDDYLQIQLAYTFTLEPHNVIFQVIALEPHRTPYIILYDIYLCLPDQQHYLSQVFQNDIEQKTDRFDLYEQPLSLFQSTYINCHEAFARKGSELTWQFQMEDVVYSLMPELVEKKEYHLFMRKLPREQIVYESFVDHVQIEYFNGEWISIPQTGMYAEFAKSKQEHMKIHFTCPEDMEPCMVSGIYDYWIRLTLVKADNCYQVPGHHHIPVLSRHRMSYHYAAFTIRPNLMQIKENGELNDILNTWQETHEIHLFHKRPETKPCIFLCFDEYPQSPFRIYFKMHHEYQEKLTYKVFTYRKDEEISMVVQDDTFGWMKSGSMSFYLPKDCTKKKLFDRWGYWVKFEFEEWSYVQMIESIQYHVATGEYDGYHSEVIPLDTSTFPIDIPFNQEPPCRAFLLEKEWVEWNISETYTEEKRNILQKEDMLQILYSAFSNQNQIPEELMLKLMYPVYVSKQHFTTETPVYLANDVPQIASVHLMQDTTIIMEKEHDDHQINRYTNAFKHLQKSYAIPELISYFYDHFTDLCKINMVYGENRYHEKMENILVIATIWNQGMNRNQEIETHFHNLLPFVLYNIRVDVIDPLPIEVELFLQLDQPFLQIQQFHHFFDVDHGGLSQEGWEIGIYPQVQEVMEYIKKLQPDLHIFYCQMYGKTKIHGIEQYHPLTYYQDFACGIIKYGKIEVEVLKHEV